ncbi:MAG: hypothetical protein E7J15_09540 [Neisseria sp.]|nr:hypothetical protein [Neisseria sp.]
MTEHISAPSPSPVGEDYLLLGQYAERAYLEYAMSVVKGRALPEVSGTSGNQCNPTCRFSRISSDSVTRIAPYSIPQ